MSSPHSGIGNCEAHRMSSMGRRYHSPWLKLSYKVKTQDKYKRWENYNSFYHHHNHFYIMLLHNVITLCDESICYHRKKPQTQNTHNHSDRVMYHQFKQIQISKLNLIETVFSVCLAWISMTMRRKDHVFTFTHTGNQNYIVQSQNMLGTTWHSPRTRLFTCG